MKENAKNGRKCKTMKENANKWQKNEKMKEFEKMNEFEEKRKITHKNARTRWTNGRICKIDQRMKEKTKNMIIIYKK